MQRDWIIDISRQISHAFFHNTTVGQWMSFMWAAVGSCPHQSQNSFFLISTNIFKDFLFYILGAQSKNESLWTDAPLKKSPNPATVGVWELLIILPSHLGLEAELRTDQLNLTTHRSWGRWLMNTGVFGYEHPTWWHRANVFVIYYLKAERSYTRERWRGRWMRLIMLPYLSRDKVL